MDINICIDKLGLNANTYRLSQNVAPHEIIDWDSGNPDTQPTTSELETAWASYTTEHDSNKYQRDRVLEYPSIGDQLDMIYHSGLGGPEFQAAIKAVKDAHPKGGN